MSHGACSYACATGSCAKLLARSCYEQAGARKVYAVEASAMADYCVLLKDANPGAFSSPKWRFWPAPRSATVAFQHFELACNVQANTTHHFSIWGLAWTEQGHVTCVRCIYGTVFMRGRIGGGAVGSCEAPACESGII